MKTTARIRRLRARRLAIRAAERASSAGLPLDREAAPRTSRPPTDRLGKRLPGSFENGKRQ